MSDPLTELINDLLGSDPRFATDGLDRPYDFPLIFGSAADEDAFVECFAETMKWECLRMGLRVPGEITRPIATALSESFANQATRMEEGYAREVRETASG